MGACVCDDGWVGDACHERVQCPNRCSGHGECSVTEIAETGIRSNNTSDETGRINSGNASAESSTSLSYLAQCRCAVDWYGLDCGKKRCRRGFNSKVCSGHGVCSDEGICECDILFSGATCDEHDCTAVSSLKEQKATGTSSNVSSLTTDSVAQNVCSGHGVCEAGSCLCDNGYIDSACSIRACPSFEGKICGGKGSCDPDGRCVCEVGWHGDACQLVVLRSGKKSEKQTERGHNTTSFKQPTILSNSQIHSIEDEDELIRREDREEEGDDLNVEDQPEKSIDAGFKGKTLHNFKFKSERHDSISTDTNNSSVVESENPEVIAGVQDNDATGGATGLENGRATGPEGFECPNSCSGND